MIPHPIKKYFFLLLSITAVGLTPAQEPQKNSLSLTHRENSLMVFADGGYITGADSILAWWAGINNKIREYEVVDVINSEPPSKYRYELSEINLADGHTFRQLIIWNARDSLGYRQLEMVVEARPFTPYLQELEQRRAEWMRFCNAREVEKLVKELYTANTLYYNHRTLISGPEALIREYRYMTNPDYQLTLTPLRILPVGPDLAYEIGQCSGSYPGKYILVWQKGEDGVWRILLDANV